MTLFKKIREWYYEYLNLLRQIRLDSKYRQVFLRTIREELADPQSKFVKMNLQMGPDGESIACLTTIPEEFQTHANDFMIQDKLDENTYFVTEFLKKITEGFNYITKPDYMHVEDPTTPNAISLTYMAVWHFTPMIYPSLKRKALAGLYGGITALTGGLGYLIYILAI